MSYTITDIETAVSADLISLDDGKYLTSELFGLKVPVARNLTLESQPLPEQSQEQQTEQLADERPTEFQDQPQGDI